MNKKKSLTAEQVRDAERLKTIFDSKKKELKITQQTFADALDVTQGAVGHYLTGRNALNLAVAVVFSRILGVKIEDFSPTLAKEVDELSEVSRSESNVSFVGYAPIKNRFPLISWVSAGGWLEAVEPYHENDVEKWPTTTVDASEKSFWLTVKGDSMTAPSGLSVPEGMIILVDPLVEPRNGKLVVAKIQEENEATFKKYVVDAGNHYLKPLNPQYHMIPINGNCTIIGVVVDAKLANLP